MVLSLRSPSASLKALYTLSTVCFSSPRAVGHPSTVQPQSLGDEMTPAEIATVPGSSLVAAPAPKPGRREMLTTSMQGRRARQCFKPTPCTHFSCQHC